MLTEIGFSRGWNVGKSSGDALRNLTCRMDIAKFSAIKKNANVISTTGPLKVTRITDDFTYTSVYQIDE